MLELKNKQRNRGDTLIEVLFAVSVFSLVAVGSLSIMNQGTATAERSLEITLVRQQIDAQAETLRYLNASYIAGSDTSDWQSIHNIAINNTEASIFDGAVCSIPTNNIFILDTHNGQYVPTNTPAGKPSSAKTFSQVSYVYNATTRHYTIDSTEGIWIEPVASPVESGNQKTIGYIDFHIRACWDSPGQSSPSNIGTIVRLYEPRS